MPPSSSNVPPVTVLRRHVRDYAGVLLALALPLALFANDPNWPFTNPFQPPWFDPFVYQGIFLHPKEYIESHQSYYPATRVPWLALGAAFYALLPAVTANIALKFLVFFLAILFFYAAAVRSAGRFAACVSTVLLGTYAFFVMSVGWDYVDGMVVMLIAAAYASVVFAAYRRSDSPLGEFLFGCIYAALVSCNPFSLVLAPSIILFYFASLVRAGRLHGTGWPARIGAAVVGFLAGTIAFALLSKLLGGDPFYLVVQLRAAFDLSSSSAASASWSIRFEPWAHLLPVSTWLAMPTTVAIISLGVGALAVVRLARGRNRNDLFMLLVAIHYLLAFGLFALSTAVSIAVMLFWFYTSYLDITAFLTLACAFGYLRPHWKGRPFWPWAVAAAIMLASFVSPLGLLIQQQLQYSAGSVKATAAFAWVFSGLVLLLLACRPRFSVLAVVGALLLGVGNVSMMTQAQLSPQFTDNRTSGFLAVQQMAEAIRSHSANNRRYVWVDRAEKPYGGLFHAGWIVSLMSAKDPMGWDVSGKFPDLPTFEFRAGDLVVIATSRPDWREAADAKLDKLHLALNPGKVETIKQGDVHFTLVLAELVPKP